MGEEEEKKNDNEKKIFWAKAIIWSVFAWIIPVCFIGWRFDIFSKASSFSLSGWGLIAVVITFIFALTVVKYIKAGFKEWSFVKQIIMGVVKIIIPLGALLGICIAIKTNIEVFIQALGVVLFSEGIAIFVNPFPKWVWEKSEGRFESAMDFWADKLYNGKDKKGE